MIPDLPNRARALVVSYTSLRRAIGISGLLLPVVLAAGGWLLFGVELQDNLSSYYHTPMRDVFVGTLCAIGVFLFCYQGHDWVENWTANLGSASALAVALFPLDAGSDPLYQQSLSGYLHCAAGGVFFCTLAFYSLFHFPSRVPPKEDPEPHERQRNRVYRASGVIILISTAAMGGYLLLPRSDIKTLCDRFNVLFCLETIAAWAFAAAWLTKGRVIVADVAIDLLALTEEKLAEHATGARFARNDDDV